MKHDASQRKLLDLLKVEGPQTAAALSKRLQMTSMGARQHLEKLAAAGLIETQDIKSGVGRPKRLWSLTKQADHYFPDRHSQLTVDMLISVKNLFGIEGLDKLIDNRAQTAAQQYQARLDNESTLEGKVKALVLMRTEEGYMADYFSEGDKFIFIENHCPICAAATQCQGFCRSELEVFQQLFLPLATVQRTEYIVTGARRCAYEIVPA